MSLGVARVGRTLPRAGAAMQAACVGCGAPKGPHWWEEVRVDGGVYVTPSHAHPAQCPDGRLACRGLLKCTPRNHKGDSDL